MPILQHIKNKTLQGRFARTLATLWILVGVHQEAFAQSMGGLARAQTTLQTLKDNLDVILPIAAVIIGVIIFVLYSAEVMRKDDATRSGDAAIAPVHAWDDGRQTWLQFAPGADIPAVYRVTPDGQEVITNFHMADDRTMVLHRTSALWHLRLGDLVLAIHNETYGATPPPAHTGTVSATVKRRVKGSPNPIQPAQPQAASGQPSGIPVSSFRVREVTPARNTP